MSAGAWPRIYDTVAERYGDVLHADAEGASVMWRKGWVEWMTKDKINSGRYVPASTKGGK